MNLATAIYQHSLNLPEMAAREALDFIQFLEQRYSPVMTKSNDDTENFIKQFAGVMPDFPEIESLLPEERDSF